MVAMDNSGEYCDEVRGVSAGLALLAMLWAANNMEEVMAVASNLATAEQSSKALKAAINQDRQALQVA